MRTLTSHRLLVLFAALTFGCVLPQGAESADSSGAGDKQAARVPHTIKPGAPVRVRFSVLDEPRAGQALPVDITIVPQAPSAALQVDVRVTEGLALQRPTGATSFANVKAASTYRHKISVIPQARGRHEVIVTVVMTSANGPLARVFALPIGVGTQAAAQKRAPVVDWTGQTIESMPAERVK